MPLKILAHVQSLRLAKDTFLQRNTSYDVLIIKISLLVFCTVHPFTQLPQSYALQCVSIGKTSPKAPCRVKGIFAHSTQHLKLHLYWLWPPYIIGQAIIFLPCGFYLLSSFLFFPRLISAVADWMSTILPHMVWP